MVKVLVLVVFVLAVSCSSLKKSSLRNRDVAYVSGTWKNDLGSTMFVRQLGRTIFGKYCTAVSETELSRPAYYLVGNIGTGMPTSIGWVVTFLGEGDSLISTTAWSGQLRMVNNEEVILTTWILTTAVTNDEDVWASTNVGKDTFHRTTPDETCTDN